MRTLLQIVQAACHEMGIPSPSAVVSSPDKTFQQLLALANREGKELAAMEGRDSGWPELRKLHTITTVADQESYAKPTDLQYFINTTHWDRSQNWPMRGPVSPQEWQVLKSGTIGSIGPRRRFRIMADRIYFDPIPTESGQEFVIEYYSNSWCQASDLTPQNLWGSDDDTPVLPDDCFITGLMWRYKRAKGLDYQEEYNIYRDLCNRELARSGMAPVVDLTGSESGTRFLDNNNIPDTFPELV